MTLERCRRLELALSELEEGIAQVLQRPGVAFPYARGGLPQPLRDLGRREAFVEAQAQAFPRPGWERSQSPPDAESVLLFDEGMEGIAWRVSVRLLRKAVQAGGLALLAEKVRDHMMQNPLEIGAELFGILESIVLESLESPGK